MTNIQKEQAMKYIQARIAVYKYDWDDICRFLNHATGSNYTTQEYSVMYNEWLGETNE